MDKETYKMIAELTYAIPPKKETPIGQKFHIGEIVRISNPSSWFSENYHKNNRLFEIQYSYTQKYGNIMGSSERHLNSYSLKHLWENNSSAWYSASELELVKNIELITEEKEREEYERLKAKYS